MSEAINRVPTVLEAEGLVEIRCGVGPVSVQTCQCLDFVRCDFSRDDMGRSENGDHFLKNYLFKPDPPCGAKSLKDRAVFWAFRKTKTLPRFVSEGCTFEDGAHQLASSFGGDLSYGFGLGSDW
jgi:hypothetical protein